MKPPSVQFQLECVRAFMTTFRQHCPRDFVDATDDTAELRHALISEEYQEWQHSSPLSSEMFDALIDLQYVTCGSILAMGVKYIGRGYTPIELTGKKIAIDGYVAKALAALRQRPLCRDSLQPALSDLVDSLNQAATANGFDMAAGFAAVHSSNMSKAEWKMTDIRPADSREERLSTGQIIVYNKAGKVLKPPGFKPADLTPYVIAALRLFESPTLAAGVPASSVKSAAADPDPAPVPPALPAVPVSEKQSRSKKVIPVISRKTAT